MPAARHECWIPSVEAALVQRSGHKTSAMSMEGPPPSDKVEGSEEEGAGGKVLVHDRFERESSVSKEAG